RRPIGTRHRLEPASGVPQLGAIRYSGSMNAGCAFELSGALALPTQRLRGCGRQHCARLASGNGEALSDEEVFLLRLSSLGRRNEPARHPTPTGPGVSCTVAILHGHLATLALAAIDKVTDVEPVLFGDGHHLLAHRSACGILLLDFDPRDAGLDCGKLRRGH